MGGAVGVSMHGLLRLLRLLIRAQPAAAPPPRAAAARSIAAIAASMLLLLTLLSRGSLLSNSSSSSGDVAVPPEKPHYRAWPSTWDGIHIFPDQLCHTSVDSSGSWLGAHPNLLAWVSTHYTGTQKIPPSMADAIRQHNPDFLVLHYRLGNLLGGNSTLGGASSQACDMRPDQCTKIWTGDNQTCAFPWGQDVIKADWFYQVRGTDNASYVMCPVGDVGQCGAGETCVPGDEPGTVKCRSSTSQLVAAAAAPESDTAPIHCGSVSATKPGLYCSTQIVSRQYGCHCEYAHCAPTPPARAHHSLNALVQKVA
jgi:hypothetical protein